MKEDNVGAAYVLHGEMANTISKLAIVKETDPSGRAV
jgi:hypothetical protein